MSARCPQQRPAEMSEPVTTLDARYSDPAAAPTPWSRTRAALEVAELSWLVTLWPDGRPHTTPVVTVWVDDCLHFTTGEGEQKAANLRANDQVLLQTGQLDWKDGLDVVVEGRALPTTDPKLLAALAAAWRERWDGRWTYEARGDRLYHPKGFAVVTYSVRPERVLAFAEGSFGHTLHRFPLPEERALAR
jgi:nitroimidazol reductase NimA-like FMN-containing flavoprotein (pyridoxamine 5'-phosphate oxidase superfamily)